MNLSLPELTEDDVLYLNHANIREAHIIRAIYVIDQDSQMDKVVKLLRSSLGVNVRFFARDNPRSRLPEPPAPL